MTSTWDYVLYDQDDAVATVTINRPDVMNVISRKVYAELDEALTLAEEDDSVKVIGITGAGDHFGAGHDIGTPVMREELDAHPRDLSEMGRLKAMDRGVYWRLHDRWRDIGKPTIAGQPRRAAGEARGVDGLARASYRVEQPLRGQDL